MSEIAVTQAIENVRAKSHGGALINYELPDYHQLSP